MLLPAALVVERFIVLVKVEDNFGGSDAFSLLCTRGGGVEVLSNRAARRATLLGMEGVVVVEVILWWVPSKMLDGTPPIRAVMAITTIHAGMMDHHLIMMMVMHSTTGCMQVCCVGCKCVRVSHPDPGRLRLAHQCRSTDAMCRGSGCADC